MAKKNEQKSLISENYLSLGLGILVVVVIGALIFNYVGNRSVKKGETSPTTEEQATEGQTQNAEVSLPTKHKVAQGENLWKIAEQYYKSGYNWTDIVQANNLTNPDILLADTELTIPDVSPKILAAATETINTAPITGTNITTESNLAINGENYTIASGDNLWQIAVRAYGDGYKWVDIAKANSLANPDLIFAGNELKIPR